MSREIRKYFGKNPLEQGITARRDKFETVRRVGLFMPTDA